MILEAQMLGPEICFIIYDIMTIPISGTFAPAMSMTARWQVIEAHKK